MKILVIGLGSMGKRRIRNLMAIGNHEIAGYDPRLDRRNESQENYSIQIYDEIDMAFEKYRPDVLIVSTPPKFHMEYAYIALNKGIDCFIEASVVDADRIKELSILIESSNVLILPSCTMKYFVGPNRIKELVQNRVIGDVLNFNYQTGQYLPDWHPWENVEDFYASHKETGGAREIVAFELTWLNSIFGDPLPINCFKGKVSSINANIDDIYHLTLQYPMGIMANITIDVISRQKAVRVMRILGTDGQLVFDGESNTIRVINSSMKDWLLIDLDSGTNEENYINPEEPYIAELRDFIASVQFRDANLFPNSLSADFRVLEILNELEEISGGS